MDVAVPSGKPAAGRDLPAGAAAGLALGAGVLALHAWRTLRLPLERLLAVVPDDALYYVGIARHLAASGTPTFDGVHPTNGFHPAWMALLTIAALPGTGAEALVRTAIAAGYALHAGTAVALWLLLRRASGTLAAPALGATLWLINPYPLLLVQQGVESSLLLLAVLLFLHAHLSALDDVSTGRAPGWRYAGAGALVCLARTDAGLLVALGLLQLWATGRRSGLPSGPAVARLALGMALLVLPWLAYSWITTGGFVQDSAAMKRTWRAMDARIGVDPVGWQVLGGAWLGIPAAWLSGAMLAPPALLFARLLIIVGAAGAVLRLARGSSWRDLVVLLMAWVLLAGAAYAWTITDLQVWHFVPAGLGLFLLTWIGWARLGAIATARWKFAFAGAGGLALAGGLAAGGASALMTPELYPWQPDIYRSLAAFDRLLPPDAVVGSFGAGIAGTLGRRPVVNLDGLVNHSVARAWRQRRWGAWVHAAGITHVADDRANLERALRFSEAPVPLTEIASVPLTGWHSGPRILWRVGPPAGAGGEAPDPAASVTAAGPATAEPVRRRVG